MNIKRYDIFPVNHQSGNEIESAGGRYVRFADVEHLQQRLTAAEQRNADLTQALERGKLWLELFRAWFGDYGVSQEDHAAIIRTLRGLPHPPSEFDKPTESGASE